MPEKSRFDKFKDVIGSLVSPSAPSAHASEMPQEFMEKRKKKLEIMGGKKSGGMLDVIYKGRKDREDALSEIDD